MSATDDRFCCNDCGHDTKLLGERYMVRDDLWDYATYHEPAYMLCIGCLEVRLDHKLSSDDFIACPLNYADFRDHSLRLRDRLTRCNDRSAA